MNESVNIGSTEHTPMCRASFCGHPCISAMLSIFILFLSFIALSPMATAATPKVLWSWGDGAGGQIGNGSAYVVNAIPMQTSISSDVTAISGGLYHSLALKSDGTVWAWGQGRYGRLGNGSTADQRTPVQVTGLSNVIAIAGGGKHSLALKSDGTVWAWGYDLYGQLGNGYGVPGYPHIQTTPVQVAGLSNVIAIAAGVDYSLALKSDGTVWGWGRDDWGQLGVGIVSYLHHEDAPVQVMNLSNVIAIASGTHHSLALKSDGTVWVWGKGNEGQIGNGTTPWAQPLPVQVTGLTSAVAIVGGGLHSLALKSDGSVWTWGLGSYGQLGNGSTANQSVPVPVTGLTSAISIAAGIYHSSALKSDGSVWTWGEGNYGQLGNGFTVDHSLPVRVSGLSHATTIASGGWHALALADPRVCVSPPSGMVSWWDGDAVSGTTVADIAGGHDGALINGATTAPGMIGDAFHLNGYNYLSAPFIYTGPFTVDFWAKAAMTSPNQSLGFAGLFSSGIPGHYDPFFQIDFDGAGNYRFHAGNNALHLNIGAVAPYWGSSLYQHLAVTYDGSMVRTYLNGALQDSGIWAGAPLQFDVVKIGINRDHSGLFKGFIDEVEIFDRALTTAEIHSIYNAVEQGKCKGPMNQPPVAVNDFYSTNEDTPLNVAAAGVLFNDTDADGDALTAALLGAGTSNGSLILNADGSFSYAPNLNFNGSDSFTYKANDGSGDSNVATVTITVNPVNDVPVAVGDLAATSEDLPVTIDVLGNDSDIDGDVLTVSAVSGAASGTVTNNGINVAYTPNLNFNGVDSFTYTVSDGNGGTATAMVSLTVMPVNDAPVLTLLGSTPVTIETGSLYSDAGATATDVEDGNITTSIVMTGTVDTMTVGSYTLTYHVTDSGGLSATPVTRTVNVVDSTPPALAASLIPVSQGDDGAKDDDEGRFRVQFAATDIADANLTITAVLIISGYATPVAVSSGQVIEFEFENEKTEVEVEKGIVEIEAPSMLLRVMATDASGNSTVVEVAPQGLNGDNDDESDVSDD